MAFTRDHNFSKFVRSVLNEPEDEESVGGSSSEAEEDVLEVREENSDSEQSANEEEDLPEGDYGELRFYIGKDGETLWMNQPPPKGCRVRERNIIRYFHAPGVLQSGKDKTNPIESWGLFFTDDILERIVDYTNRKISLLRVNYDRERDAKDTTLNEIKAVIGLLYLAGVRKASHVNMRDLWATNGLGLELFRCVMSLSRFNFLLSAIRFDDILSRNERKKLDRLAPVREMFDHLVNNFQKYYSPGNMMTLDEKLEAFRGRCPFRQFIKSKPAKYGLKVFALVDAKMVYTYNLEIYAGKQPEGPFHVSNSGMDVTLRMVQPIAGSNRNVTTDNWFSSVPLSKELLQRKLTTVGTLRKNKREIPPEFLQKRALYSSLFGFDDDMATLVTYCPKKGKNVLLLSTMHDTPAIDVNTGEQRKPDIITCYNDTKGGVDTVDQLSALYSVARKTRRWPLVIFFSLLNTAAINAQVIVASNNKFEKATIRRQFIEELGLDLVRPLMHTRVADVHLPRELRLSIGKYLPGNQQEQPERERRARGRCEVCPRSADRKTPFSCEKCYRMLCKEHMKVCCEDCL